MAKTAAKGEAAKSSAAPAHTPLPWELKSSSIVGHWEDGQEIQVALLTNPKWSTGPGYDETSAANARACNERMRSEAPANAQLIIKAVAAHQALYEALSAVTRQFEDVARNTVSGYQHGGAVIISGDVRQQCRAALKLAEEK